MLGKGAYLKKITSSLPLGKIKKEIEGTTPPTVFVGSAGYPYVQAGPLMTEEINSELWGLPEKWVNLTQDKILSFRLNLVRGKKRIKVDEINKFVDLLQHAALSKNAVYGDVEFKYINPYPTMSEEVATFGPSGLIKRIDLENGYWNKHLEKVYYDEQKALEAIVSLYNKGLFLSQIQQALSVGAMGIKRKLVPTKWAITAVDSTLADYLYGRIQFNESIECYEVYVFENLNNKYVVILTPGVWQYQWTEAFINVMKQGTHIFEDHEYIKPKNTYSKVGGCYYSCKLAILEHYNKAHKRGGAIVLREAYSNYVPLGVFNVRENVRLALRTTPKRFVTLRDALNYAKKELRISISVFLEHSPLLERMLMSRQETLIRYIK